VKHLRKYVLVMIAAAVALAALASSAAAAPRLSPVPDGCGACESENFGFSLGSSTFDFISGLGQWSYRSTAGYGGIGGGSFADARLTLNEGLCHNEGLNLTTNPLKGFIGWAGEGKNTVGMLLEPAEGSAFANCKLSGVEEAITGSVIGTLSPTNTPTTSLSLNYSQNNGVQSPNKMEGDKAVHQLSIASGGGLPQQLGWAGTLSMAASRAVELNTASGTPTFITEYEGGFSLTGGRMWFQTKNGLEVKCTSTLGTGTFNSATGGNVNLSFTGCTNIIGEKCTEGVKTRQLKAQLVYTSPAKETAEGRQTALLLSPETGEVVSEFVCGTAHPVASVVKGNFLAVISPLGGPSNTFALSLKQRSGKQEYTTYEGAAGETLEANLLTSIAGAKPSGSGIEVASPTIKLNDGGVETIK
jgi:hypothetical protein